MAWDSASALRRRQESSSTASSRSLPHHGRQPSRPTLPTEPKSAHVADPFLQKFLSPSFDAADYLNASLPPLQAHMSSISPSMEGSVPLSELSSQAQTILSQLNAQTTRLTNTLTQLTDEILRSGSRLAYEVELLRGETLSLSESLTDGLQGDVVKFVPGGIKARRDSKVNGAGTGEMAQKRASIIGPVPSESTIPVLPEAEKIDDPEYIQQLRTLTLVRARLDSVIKTFGDAMEFVFPPSGTSVSSSFLSVSAPDVGSHEHSTEEKGQQVLQQLRDEIAETLAASRDPVAGIEKAAQRIEELKELSRVWTGTAEEKGRTRFIDSLARIVEDRHKDLVRELEQGGRRAEVEAAARKISEGPAVESSSLSAYGIMSRLQRLRSGL